MLTQPKLDLAVLFRLHQHAEKGGGPITPDDVVALFSIFVPIRRVEVALEHLEKRGEVEREYHEFHGEEGLWQISREGITAVDRAVRSPTTFIGRLSANGDDWLNSEEAAKAILNKVVPRTASIQTTFDMIPATEKTDEARPVHAETNWTKWSVIVAALFGIATLIVTILIQRKMI